MPGVLVDVDIVGVAVGSECSSWPKSGSARRRWAAVSECLEGRDVATND